MVTFPKRIPNPWPPSMVYPNIGPSLDHPNEKKSGARAPRGVMGQGEQKRVWPRRSKRPNYQHPLFTLPGALGSYVS